MIRALYLGSKRSPKKNSSDMIYTMAFAVEKFDDYPMTNGYESNTCKITEDQFDLIKKLEPMTEIEVACYRDKFYKPCVNEVALITEVE